MTAVLRFLRYMIMTRRKNQALLTSLLTLGLFLFITGCQSTSAWRDSGGRDSGAASQQAPADLLQEREIINQGQASDLWFTEDGTLISSKQFVGDLTNQDLAQIQRDVLNDPSTGQSLSSFVTGNDQNGVVTQYMQNDQVVQGRVMPYNMITQNNKIKVAILLPLSGAHKGVGQSIFNAAQLALFDIAGDHFELLPRDTKGTTTGAKAAISDAINNGADLVLGPLFASSVRAIKPEIRNADLKMITFSTDWTLADDNTFVMGFTAFDQVRRVMAYAASKGYAKQAILAPYTPYGDSVTKAFNAVAQNYKIDNVMVERYRAGDENFNDLVRKFTNFEERRGTLKQEIEAIKAIPSRQRNAYQRNELARLKIMHTKGDLPFDAVLLPMGGNDVRTITSLLQYYDVDLSKARFLGTGLWDDAAVQNEISMAGGWYAAPSPRNWDKFVRQYKSVYNEQPSRIASLGYDATALVAVLSRQALSGNPNYQGDNNARRLFTRSLITNPNGFVGVDGIFRFGRDGLAERGLAVLEINESGKVKEISPASTTFQTRQF